MTANTSLSKVFDVVFFPDQLVGLWWLSIDCYDYAITVWKSLSKINNRNLVSFIIGTILFSNNCKLDSIVYL